MQYVLRHPLIITSRLVPGVKVGNGEIRVEAIGQEPNGRTYFRFEIDTPAGQYATDAEKIDDGVSVSPLAGEGLGDLAARAVSLICDELASEETPCEWLPPALQAWRAEHATDLYDTHEDLEALRD